MTQKVERNRIESAGLTDVGVRRSHNQDSYAELLANSDEQWQKQGHIFVVADGMGAHAVGELASKKAAEIIPHIFAKYAEQGPAQALYRAFQEANQAIFQMGSQNLGFSGMGTTATALVLHPTGAWIGHVGDTRVYRIRGGKIEQLTFDHSLRWEVARRRGVDPEKVTDVASNAIVRSLGPEATVQVDIEGPHSVEAGDIFVLCSDGLSGLVSDAEIGAIVSSLSVQEAAKFLVALANLRGGPDNITVLIIRILEFQPGERPLRQSWWQRLGQVWQRQTLPVRLAVSSIPLALVCLVSLMWALDLPSQSRTRPWMFVISAVSFATAVALMGLSWYLSQREENVSEASEEAPQHGLTIRPAQVYRQASCAANASLFERLAQVQRHLQELVNEAGWPYPKESYQRLQGESQRLLQQRKVAEAFHAQLQAIHILADTARRHQQRQEVFLPNWDGD
ncbi:MAG: protein phosphatase 2C domain-containing protein [Gemmatales bacterium]|nr:protein phosphatase 2C domain-containing protein [Gemmatales bacterium]MCS7160644.1 protein phosphatase 2C domain-containing protein [Gemmatales bacterium]MDW8175845.1 protein phosphatase 2C domain-containing protein [Gemmatales bacterium]MDW8222024.1 protein phosphatase 2C domain-containing protein [Gemmatales bacterium]